VEEAKNTSRGMHNTKPKTEILINDWLLEQSIFLGQGLQLSQAPLPCCLAKLAI
jgi:hypothetical protein